MRRSEALQGVRLITFRSILGRCQSSELNQMEAAELLGVSERTFRRRCGRYEEGGEAGLLDQKLEHEWLAGHDAVDLIVTMDNATSEICPAFLVTEEGTASTFRARLEVFGRRGLPLSFYTGRGSHYFVTPEAGGPVDRKNPTQVGRAQTHLGVEPIAAYSPQARGRSERLFATLHDRLMKDWRRPSLQRLPTPTAFCAMSASRCTTPASRSRRSSQVRPSSPFPVSI